MFRLSILAALLLLAGTVADAQRYFSPPATAKITIAGKQLTVDYYTPSMHGRKIFGELVPYGEIWCPGANVATGLATPVSLQIGTVKVPKGTWSLWVIPTEKDWTLVVNKQSGQHHLDYDPSQDIGRTKLNLRRLSSPVETLRFELSAAGGSKATLALLWETTEVSVPLTLLP